MKLYEVSCDRKIKFHFEGRVVFLIQTGTLRVNDDIMELLILAFACRAACARRVILVVPYLPYCKQNKMRKRGSITCKLIAQLICSTGIDNVITIDLHSKEIQVWSSVILFLKK